MIVARAVHDVLEVEIGRVASGRVLGHQEHPEALHDPDGVGDPPVEHVQERVDLHEEELLHGVGRERRDGHPQGARAVSRIVDHGLRPGGQAPAGDEVGRAGLARGLQRDLEAAAVHEGDHPGHLAHDDLVENGHAVQRQERNLVQEGVQRRGRDGQHGVRVGVHVARAPKHEAHVGVAQLQRAVDGGGQNREELGAPVLGLAHVAQELVLRPQQSGLAQTEEAQLHREAEHLREDGPGPLAGMQGHPPVVSQQCPDAAQRAPLVHGRADAVDERAPVVGEAQPLRLDGRAPLAAPIVAVPSDIHRDLDIRRAEHPLHEGPVGQPYLLQPVPPRGARCEHVPAALAVRGQHRVGQRRQPRGGHGARLVHDEASVLEREPQPVRLHPRHLGQKQVLALVPGGVGHPAQLRVPVLAPAKLHEIRGRPRPPVPPRRRRAAIESRWVRGEKDVHRLGLGARRLVPGVRVLVADHVARHQVDEDGPLQHPHVLHAHQDVVGIQGGRQRGRRNQGRPRQDEDLVVLPVRLGEHGQPFPRGIPKLHRLHRARDRRGPEARAVAAIHGGGGVLGGAPERDAHPHRARLRHRQGVIGHPLRSDQALAQARGQLDRRGRAG